MLMQQNANAVRKPLIIDLPDLAVAADIVAEVAYRAKNPQRVVTAQWIFREATVGVDGANTLQLTASTPLGVFSDTGVLVVNQAAGTVIEQPLTAGNLALILNQPITLDITQGVTANIGRAALQIDIRRT